MSSLRFTTPVRLAAVVTLVAAGTWGGTALDAGAGADDKPAVAPAADSSASNARGGGPAYVYKSKVFTVPGGAGNLGNAVVKWPSGYKVSGGGVQTGSSDAIVNETRPVDGNDGDAAPDDGWISYVINPSASDQTHSVWAVCARV